MAKIKIAKHKSAYFDTDNNFIGDEGLYYLKHWKLFVIQRLNIRK